MCAHRQPAACEVDIDAATRRQKIVVIVHVTQEYWGSLVEIYGLVEMVGPRVRGHSLHHYLVSITIQKCSDMIEPIT